MATDHNSKSTLVHIEFLRILAIFLVLFNHTGTNGFFLFADELDSPFFPFYIFLSIADKIAVPIFFMIAGALLLGKEESIRDIYTKRVFRYIVILVVVSFLYWLWQFHYNISVATLRVFWKKLYSHHMSTQLWYLYSYIGLLIMLPLLRKLAGVLKKNDYIYLFIIHIIFIGVIPVIQYLLGKGNYYLSSDISVPIFTSKCIFYALMGYYAERVFDINNVKKRDIIACILTSLIAIGISCFMTMYRADVTGELGEKVSQEFHERLIAIPTISTYVLAKYIFVKRKISIKLKNIILLVGSTTFGIYLMEGMLRSYLYFVYSFYAPYIGTLPACILWIVLCICVGCGITLILKRIPIIKKFL